MKYSVMFALLVLLSSCGGGEKKHTLVVYPEYCGGCVVRNFSEIGKKHLSKEFDIYFDTTDTFVLTNAKSNRFKYHHIANEAIAAKWGDYANVVVISADGKVTELKTNETIRKGAHF